MVGSVRLRIKNTKGGEILDTLICETLTGITPDILSPDSIHCKQAFGNRLSLLTPVIIGISAIGSAFVDNIVFVAAFMPIVDKLQQTPLLWALLHGTCLGGNITMIGSTANIVALGMLEKRYRTHVHFGEWLKVGAIRVSVFLPIVPQET